MHLKEPSMIESDQEETTIPLSVEDLVRFLEQVTSKRFGIELDEVLYGKLYAMSCAFLKKQTAMERKAFIETQLKEYLPDEYARGSIGSVMITFVASRLCLEDAERNELWNLLPQLGRENTALANSRAGRYKKDEKVDSNREEND